MPPSIALIVWLLLLLGLLCFDPAKEKGASLALWVPLIWMFFMASRLPSQWISLDTGMDASSMEEGNGTDRAIFLILITLAIVILVARSFNWIGFFTRNLALTAFLLFALVSAVWSDFPFVTFKRWFRDLGTYIMVLVIVSDPQPLVAVRTVLRRFGYLLIPLSFLLCKYFPSIGMQYWIWTGTPMYVGPTTSKNMLGVLCMVSGLVFFWDTVNWWSRRRERKTKLILFVNFVFLALTAWLIHLSDSATSRVCLILGCLVILAARSNMTQRHPGVLKFLIPVLFCSYAVFSFGFGHIGTVAAAVGRDPSLTDRTVLWKILLDMKTNPIVGTGYESFWLGERVSRVWQNFGGGINEAHNGYLELYLNLGFLGVTLLAVFLIAAYLSIWQGFKRDPYLGSLGLALWTVQLFYNVTEAAFKFHLMWVTFLLVAFAAGSQARALAGTEPLSGHERPLGRFKSGLRSKRPTISGPPGERK